MTDSAAPFADRKDAGRQLGRNLERYKRHGDTVVLGLPRGGVVVAFEVAKALDIPLDVFLVRKLGVLGHEELALGAIASGGVTVFNEDVVRALALTKTQVEETISRERLALERRELLYRGHFRPQPLAGKTVIVVDDGLATGASMRTAVRSLKDRGPARVVVAVPVGPADTCAAIGREVEEMVCLLTPEPFYAVGPWYAAFSQVSDDEVVGLLEKSRDFGSGAAALATDGSGT